MNAHRCKQVLLKTLLLEQEGSLVFDRLFTAHLTVVIDEAVSLVFACHIVLILDVVTDAFELEEDLLVSALDLEVCKEDLVDQCFAGHVRWQNVTHLVDSSQ